MGDCSFPRRFKNLIKDWKINPSTRFTPRTKDFCQYQMILFKPSPKFTLHGHFVCLYGVYPPTQDHSYGDVTITVPHLLWHGASVYNGHLRRPVTLTPIAERLAVELSLPVFTILVNSGWDSNTQPSAYGANALTNCATAAVCWSLLMQWWVMVKKLG